MSNISDSSKRAILEARLRILADICVQGFLLGLEGELKKLSLDELEQSLRKLRLLFNIPYEVD